MAIQRESAELASVVEETVSGVRVVKGFGSQRVQAPRLRAEADDVYDASMAAARVRGRYLPALDLLPNIGLILVLFVGGHQVLDGTLSLGAPGRVQHLHRPAHLAAALARPDHRQRPAGRRPRRSGCRPCWPPTPVIVDRPRPGAAARRPRTVRSGSRRCRSATRPGVTCPCSIDLDLIIAAGESVALVGATGSGKSTVARLLPRFYDVDGGRILLDGVDVPRPRAARPAPGHRPRVRGDVPVQRHHRQQHRLRRPRRRRRASSSGPPAWPAPTSSSGPCPTATAPRSASGASRCRAASASASPSPGPSWPTPGC